jgi:hypothetical protein
MQEIYVKEAAVQECLRLRLGRIKRRRRCLAAPWPLFLPGGVFVHASLEALLLLFHLCCEQFPAPSNTFVSYFCKAVFGCVLSSYLCDCFLGKTSRPWGSVSRFILVRPVFRSAMLAGSSTASSTVSRYELLLHQLAFIVSIFRVSAVWCAFPIVTIVPVLGLFVFCIFEVFVF